MNKLKSTTPSNTCRNLAFWILVCILKRHPVVVCALFIFVKYVKLIYSTVGPKGQILAFFLMSLP